MLAAALHLYLKTSERLIHLRIDKSMKPKFKNGWLSGYRACFSHQLGIRFEDCPADLEVLEEVVLARNRVQHPESIVGQRTLYSNSDLGKLEHPFFVDERERGLLADIDDAERAWLMPPTLHVSAEKLATAIEEVEKFGDWLGSEIDTRVYGRQTPSV